jgi:hypothetical protein
MSHESVLYTYLMILHASWVLLPLVPAVLIYWLFPDSKVAMSGPFASLTVRASGAFAGYLIIVAATYSVTQRIENTIGGFQHSFWSVRGTITLLDSDNKTEITSDDLLRKLNIQTKPEILSAQSHFITLDIPERGPRLPFLVLDIPEFGRKTIDLSVEERVDNDDYNHEFKLKGPIVIQKTQSIKEVPVNSERK